jgi:hypothetical protein
MYIPRTVVALCVLLTASMATRLALASTPPDDKDEDAALALPVQSASPPRASQTFYAALELAQTDSSPDQGGIIDAQRASFDLRADYKLASDWRAQMSDYLDLLWPGTFSDVAEINTLKELYVSWQARSELLVDVGRINIRQGVAYGYNPTDFLRADSLRTVDSIDPNSLRLTRLGTVMLRSQWLWDSGSLTALYAPELTEHASPAAWDPDIGATNSSRRWMISLSQRLLSSWTPQWIVFDTGTGTPQLGVNITRTISDATITYLEFAGGESRSQFQQALQTVGPAEWHSQLAAGANYTFKNKLSIVLELEYDGSALTRHQWSAARLGNPNQFERYVGYVAEQQEPPTLASGFLAATWQDLLLRHLDLTAFLRRDLIDDSSLIYTELRYHWSHVDAALRRQDYRGGPTTDYGLSPIRQSWQLLLDYYL